MEPIKINVEVNLGEATLTVLKNIFNTSLVQAPTTEATTKKEKPQTEPAPAPQPQPQPQPEAPATVEDDDLPPNDAPDPVKKTPTEDDARNAVKAARGRGVSAKTIKDFMKKEFDIASSVECPAERRQALIDGLNKLAA
jgi:hypothetical protein